MINKYIQVISLVMAAFIVTAASAQNAPQASISEFEDTTHLELSGMKSWKYEIKRDSDKSLKLVLPKISPDAEKKISAYKDRYIKSVKITSQGLQSELVFELNDAQIEHFDYMTDDPSLLIVDFYKKPSEEVAPKAAQTPKKTSGKKSSKNPAPAAERNPASGEILVVEKEDPSLSLERRFGAFDSSDEEFGRFQIKDYEVKESSIIASKQNVYLKFPPLMMPVSRMDHWLNLQPEYVIKPKDSQETKEAQLLQSLYLRGRESVFLKTLDYFSKKYPKSECSEILQNLAADIYLKRWRKSGKSLDYDLAKDRLSDLVERYPDSSLTQRNHYLLAYANLERGEALPALESIQKLIQLYPQSEEIPHLRFAEAESLMDLKKYDDARGVYEQMIKDQPQSIYANQAIYRRGDVAMRAQNWDEAQQQYNKALTVAKNSEGAFPNAHFNRGEALFWNGKYQESIQELAQFLKLFPSHPYGAYAMTRIGESFDILGANKQRVVGAYLESYFRYPNQPGAKVARMRLLSQQMKTMKDKAFEKALKEVEEIGKELELSEIKDFVTIMVAEGFEQRGQFDESLKLLSKFYQENPNSQHRVTIQRQVRKNIANEMKRRVDSNNYLSALKFFEEYSKTWLQNSNRIDIDYLRAKSFEQAGVLEESRKLYQNVARRLEEISGTQDEKERAIHEHLPSKDQVYLRLAKVFNDEREYVKAYQTLKKINEPKGLASEETIERTQLMADLWIQRQDFEDASQSLEILVKDYEGKDQLLAPALVKQAQVNNHLKKWDKAVGSADRALKMNQVAPNLRSSAYSEKVKAQLELGLKASAIETLQAQLEEFEGKSPTEYVRYKLGELLYQEGDISAAEAVWTKLKENGSGVLWKIAEEKIKASQFEENYSRYIDRIPAMSTQGGKVEE